MYRVASFAALAGLCLAASATPAAADPQILGPDAAACRDPAVSSLLVHAAGFKNGDGTVRVEAYGPNPDDFLAKGKWVRRIDLPLAGRRAIDVCVKLPAPGRYAIAVRHDANANAKSDWNDGGGFTRNPKLSLFHLKPKFDRVVIPVGRGENRTDIVMNYRHGLSIGPEDGGA